MNVMNNTYHINLPIVRPCCRIFIADQHQLLIFAFRRLIENYPHLEMIGNSGSGLEALAFCRLRTPSLVIVDPCLFDMSGPDFIKSLKRRQENIKTIAYLARRDDDKLLEFIHSGVDGIVDKNSSISTLLKAIHCVNGGGMYFDEININAKAVLNPGAVNNVEDYLPNLSSRERQILKLIAEGQRNKGIASLLSISVKTVESHRFNLMKKLNAHCVAELVSWARKYNL